MSRNLILVAVILGALASLYQGWDMFARTPPRVMLQGADDSFYYFWVRSPIVDRDFNFANDLATAPTIDDSARTRAQAEPLTPLGRVRNKYPIGWAVATLPFFLVAHIGALIAGGPADGWHPVYFIVIWFGHLSYTVLGLFAARRVLARFADAEAATVGVLVGWLVTPLLYYQSARISMPHGLAFTLIALLYERTLVLTAEPNRCAPWLIGGAAAGLLLVTRPLCAPYLLFPLLAAFRLLAAPATRSVVLRRLPWAVAPAVALIALQLLAQRQLHGAWRLDTYDSEPFYFTNPELVASLFSPQHGWFYWHPFALVGVATFVVGVFRRLLPWEWLVSLLIVTYLNASWWCWWWGSSFGNRSFEGATLFVMAGFAVLWKKTAPRSRWRVALVTTFVVGIVANALLLTLYLTGAISRGDPVTYREMAAALVHQTALLLSN